MAMTAKSERCSSNIANLVKVFIRLMKEKVCSASALVLGRVLAMMRRRWMFGNASESQAPRVKKKIARKEFHGC